MSFFRIASLLVAGFLPASLSAVESDLSVVERWMETNRGVRTLKIDFLQTRTMKSLAMPITQPGTLWLNYATDQFRWQTGDPAVTAVVRRGNQLFIIRPNQKKFERRPFGSSDAGPAGMSALAGGFPRNIDDFRSKYAVLDIVRRENTHRIVSRPLGPSGRGVGQFVFVIEAESYRLLGIEIALEDGSTLDTVFQRVQPNLPIPEAIFAPPLDGFKEVKF